MCVNAHRLAYVALLLIVTCINSTFSLMAPVLPTVKFLCSHLFRTFADSASSSPVSSSFSFAGS